MVVVLAAGGAAFGFWRGFRWWHQARVIEDTPTSRVRSAVQGYVELTGRGRLLPGEPILAPLSGITCTWWSYQIEEYRSNGKTRSWHTVATGTSESLFCLEDDTGRCLVDPEGAEVYPGGRDTWYGDTPRPVARPSGIRGFRGFGERYRYRESRLHPGEPLYAIGLFRTHSAPLPGTGMEVEVAQLLARWKRDPARRAEFDTDGDGVLSLEEWEHARAAARRQVTAEQLEAAQEPGVNVLARCPEGRPFLLGATNEARLARHYRLRGLLGIVIFMAGTAAATWLLLVGLR
jgi:hypothetical protein